jgi:oxygen-independent coproporphyrinogen-3 oxidase
MSFLYVRLEKDNLVEVHGNKLMATEKGRVSVRNVCLPFDLRL